MSLCVLMCLQDGIIMAADKRRTCPGKNNNCGYLDDSVKVVPFPNNIVIGYTGSRDLTTELSVNKWLEKCRDRFGSMCQINMLPGMLVQSVREELERAELRGHNWQDDELDIHFLVAGYAPDGSGWYIYNIDIKDRDVSMSVNIASNGGACLRGIGCNKVVAAMDKYIDLCCVPLMDGPAVAKCMIDATTVVLTYSAHQYVGGGEDIYVISKDGSQVGWYRDGKIVPDKKCPPDAYLEYAKKMEEWMKEPKKK